MTIDECATISSRFHSFYGYRRLSFVAADDVYLCRPPQFIFLATPTMTNYLATHIGRFRILAFLEGLSLLVLVFISIPLKRLYGITEISAILGPIHGVLFLLFLLYAIFISVEYSWNFWRTTWKVIVASFIPFGTFYVDHILLKPLHAQMLGS